VLLVHRFWTLHGPLAILTEATAPLDRIRAQLSDQAGGCPSWHDWVYGQLLHQSFTCTLAEPSITIPSEGLAHAMTTATAITASIGPSTGPGPGR
jgi:hypothetical protein